MLGIIDESGGTGAGYDVAYVDENTNGDLMDDAAKEFPRLLHAAVILPREGVSVNLTLSRRLARYMSCTRLAMQTAKYDLRLPLGLNVLGSLQNLAKTCCRESSAVFTSSDRAVANVSRSTLLL